jgi:hypothetical protein
MQSQTVEAKVLHTLNMDTLVTLYGMAIQLIRKVLGLRTYAQLSRHFRYEI